MSTGAAGRRREPPALRRHPAAADEAKFRAPLGPEPSATPALASGFWLFFNAYAEIGYCSDLLAALIGRTSAGLRGQAVTSILQQLPLRRDTPGGNIGLMTMNYLDRRWPLELRVGDRRWLPVYGWIRALQLGTGPAFVVELAPREQDDPRTAAT